jgi:hypothetical protein
MMKGLTLLAAQEIGGSVKRRATAIGYFVAAGIVGGAGSIYALNALRDWLGTQFTGLQANLMVAGGLIVIAVSLAIVGYAQKRRPANNSTATSAAILAAPLAVKTIGRLNIATITTIGVLAVGAYLGRQAAKS